MKKIQLRKISEKNFLRDVPFIITKSDKPYAVVMEYGEWGKLTPPPSPGGLFLFKGDVKNIDISAKGFNKDEVKVHDKVVPTIPLEVIKEANDIAKKLSFRQQVKNLFMRKLF